MLEIRRYESSDYDEVWNLHVSGLQNVGAYLGNGPWDNDLYNIEDAYLHNRGEFLIGIYEGRIVAMGEVDELKRAAAERMERTTPVTMNEVFMHYTAAHLITDADIERYGSWEKAFDAYEAQSEDEEE